jgi:Carboxypeptidase regulatory-like domain
MAVRGPLLSLALVVAASSASAAVSGRVVSADGQPMAGVAVGSYALETIEARAARLMAGQDRRALATARSGADGSFHFEGDDAILLVGVRADGFAPAMATAVPGEPATLRLKPAALRRGTVTASGRPVADATLAWLANWQDPQSAEMIVHSGKDGAYELPDPDQWASGAAVAHRDYALALVTPENKWGSRLSQELVAGVPLQGQVVDEKSGRGLGGATVWVGGWPRARSAADGSFTIAHAPANEKNVIARTDTMAGTPKDGGDGLVILAQPVRRLSGSVREAGSKRPIAGALVAAAENVRWMTVTALSDERGQYVVALPAGRYWAQVSGHGYVFRPPHEGPADTIDLRKRAAAERDFELDPMPRVAGRVQDEQDRPVDGAQVSLGFEGMGTLYAGIDLFADMEAGPSEPGLTAADGSFSLDVPAYARETSLMSMQPALIALKKGYAVGRAKLAASGTAGAVVITLPRGLAVKGRVTSTDGRPLGDVAISVAEAGPILSFQSLASLRDKDAAAWARTDADGRFALQLQPVVHQLFFSKQGRAPKLVDGFDPRAGEDLDVVLDAGTEIRGRVVRSDGRGVGGANVTLQDRAQTLGGTALTEADGSFAIADLAPGAYELQVNKPDAGVHVTRRVEAPSSDLRVQLGPAVTVRGRVLDAASRAPVPRFSIHVSPASRPDMEDVSSGRNQEFDAAEGTFVLEDVTVGGSTLLIKADGYRQKTIEGVAAAGEEGNPELEVALEAGVSIRGRVTGVDGTALADVRVDAVHGRGEGVGAETDENGEYELKAVAPGEVTVRFEKEGLRSARRTVQAGGGTRADVTLSRGLSLNGVVLYEDAGLAKAFVTASSSATDADSQNATTDATGRFTLNGLAPGRYEISAAADEKGKAELHDVDVATAGPLRLVIERTPTAILTGTIVGLGEPREGRLPAVIVEVDAGEGRSAYGIVQASGTFRIENAPAGRVTVSAQAQTPNGGSHVSQRNELNLAPGSESTTVVEFRDDIVVSGVVTRAGAGMRGAMVSFRNGDDTMSMANTDLDGRYQVNLAAGPYRVTVAGRDVNYETDYVAAESGAFDIDVTGGTLRGRAVQAGTDTAVPEVDVSLWLVGGEENTPATSVQTNAQGTFEAPLLREGRYRVVTARKGYGQRVREVELAHAATTEVLLELQPAAGVSVKVSDARDGRTLEAIVVVRDGAKRIVANQHAGPDEDGAVVIPLADGPYILSTSATGYGTRTLPIVAPAKGLQVGLTPGGTLVIESPRNLRGRIRLVQPDGEEYVRCWCNGISDIKLQGRRTTVEHVAAGSYTIELVDGPETFSPRPVVIAEDQTATVTIE